MKNIMNDTKERIDKMLKKSEKILNAGKSHEWISVKEELPKEAGWVKAKDTNGNVVKRYYNPIQTTRFPKGFSYIINGALSWRDENIVEWLKEIHE